MGGGGRGCAAAEEEDDEVEEGGGRSGRRWPPWLRPLLSTAFFVQCKRHADAHKSECNMFCLDCASATAGGGGGGAGALCALCVGDGHRGHRAIQVRRSSYHDVIRVAELQKVMLDIGGVQTYIINSARVVFLNERPQPRPGKGVVNTCEVCDRSLLDAFRFCSLGCKLRATTSINGGGRYRGKASALESDSEGSTGSRGSERSSVVQSAAGSPSGGQGSSFRTAGKRRKGVPHRAPFGVDL